MGSTLFFCLAFGLAALFHARRLGINLGLAPVLLGMLLVFHGPAYLYYTRVWGPGTDFYFQILEAAPGADVIGTLDVALGLLLLSVCAGIAFIDAGAGLSREDRVKALARWAESPVVVPDGAADRLRIAGWLAVAVLAAFALAENQVGRTLSYALADLGEFEKIALRRELGGSQFYLFNLLEANVFPFLAFCLVVLARIGTPRMNFLALCVIGLVLLAKLATLSKAPPAVFILQLLVLEAMRRSLRISPAAIGALVLAAAGLFTLTAFLANPTLGGIGDALDFLFYRTFMIVNEGLMEYFSAIPNVLPHTLGLENGALATLAGEQPLEPTYWVVGELHRGAFGSTTTVMFMGDAWAQFGWAGVIVAGLVAGALVRWLDIQLIMRRGKTVGTIAGLALGHYGIFVAHSTALQTALLTGGLLLVLPLVALVSGSAPASASPQPEPAAGQEST